MKLEVILSSGHSVKIHEITSENYMRLIKLIEDGKPTMFTVHGSWGDSVFRTDKVEVILTQGNVSS